MEKFLVKKSKLSENGSEVNSVSINIHFDKQPKIVEQPAATSKNEPKLTTRKYHDSYLSYGFTSTEEILYLYLSV